MRNIETKVIVLFAFCILVFQVAGFVLLDSTLKTVIPKDVNSLAGFFAAHALPGKIIGSFYMLQLGLVLVTLLCFLLLAGSIYLFKRVLRSLGGSAMLAPTDAPEIQPDFRTAGSYELKDVAHVFAVMREVIARREDEIKRLAYWDTLTGLPNRIQFISLLNQAIASNRQARGSVAKSCFVLMMDLDRFKNVNDIMGHSFGDLLLKQVSLRLREALPKAQLARLGGDEFALLLPDSDLDAARAAAQSMLQLLEHPITIEDQTVDLDAGIGVAGYPVHGDTADVILSHAEVAMYQAKRNLGSNFTIYCPEIDRGSQQNLSLISELRHAIQENQLRLYVQPKFGLKENRVVGVETLVRWHHPARGFLAPDQFVVFAEKTGIIRLLTRWILEKSALLCKELLGQGMNLKISVNVSTHDLLDPELPRKVAEIFAARSVPNSSFCLEITESAIMNDPLRSQITLERLSAMGVELSIDDFGTGYSSLSYLKRLPVNELKIDKSFVVQMGIDDDDRTIVKSTIDLGHNMGMRVVAEGVENPAVLRLLTVMNCDLVQGNLISAPIPAELFAGWMAQGSLNQPQA